MISYQTEGVRMPAIKRRETSAWIKSVAASYGKKVGDIAYIFCNDEKILEVNKEYLQHDYYTDIITFDYCEGNVISGDLFISLDTVKSNSELVGATYEQELHRVTRLSYRRLCAVCKGLCGRNRGVRQRDDCIVSGDVKASYGDFCG